MFRKLKQYGVIPMVVVDSPDNGLRLCEALIAGGLPVAEITFRTEAAEAAIAAIAKRFPEILLGAGTVLTVEQLQRAMDAGAGFAVSPGCNPTVVREAVKHTFPFAPGVCTPTDIECALELGCRVLKFFPAEAVGGVKCLRALSGPYGHLGVEFCPTGGINADNMTAYLSLPAVAFVGGSWIAKKDSIRTGDWDEITRTARAAVERAHAVA
jgi:2-dehydro-3-deoxyphosphogluconate aldolase/(4S)-4-hydroxy-2-oxoglutarate aldolase